MAVSARDEALNAVEFYNRPAARRSLEAFLVHMHIAWTYLLQAEFLKDGVNYFYRDPKRPHRYQMVEGDRKAWDLEKCVKTRWPDPKDPVRNNVELTIRLRNRIEHRYEQGLIVASAGFMQALIMNFEEELIGRFDSMLSIADVVHLPVTLSTFSREGVARLIAAQTQLPEKLKNFFIDYRSGLDPEIVNDRRFEFRVEIIQKRVPKSEADLAVSFVSEDELSPDEKAAYAALEKTGRVIIREKNRPVSNLDRLRPKAACRLIEAGIPFRFRPSSEFPQAWKHFQVRPLTGAKGKARQKTDERYCFYDSAWDDYVYTPKFVELIIKACGTEQGFRKVVGRAPTSKNEAHT
jgi:hypothetical protein